jgi:hypothetical protein
MRALRALWAALLPAYEVRVIPWPGWDDDETAPPVWALDDWRPFGLAPLQGGVRGVVAWRRIPRSERVLRAIRHAIEPPAEAPAPDPDSEPEFGDEVRVRSPLAGAGGSRPPGWR